MGENDESVNVTRGGANSLNCRRCTKLAAAIVTLLFLNNASSYAVSNGSLPILIDPCHAPMCGIDFYNSSVMIPCPNNCAKFLRCNHFYDWIAEDCAPGTLFDTVERKPKQQSEAVCHEPCDSFSGYAPPLCVRPPSTGSTAADDRSPSIRTSTQFMNATVTIIVNSTSADRTTIGTMTWSHVPTTADAVLNASLPLLIDPCHAPICGIDFYNSSVMIPCPNNCAKFLRCNHFYDWIVEDCAPGTLFDTIERKPKLANDAVCHKPCDSFSGYAPLLCIGPTSTGSTADDSSSTIMVSTQIPNTTITINRNSTPADRTTIGTMTWSHVPTTADAVLNMSLPVLIDPCHAPMCGIDYYNSSVMIPCPNNCAKFLRCNHFYDWVAEDCAPGTLFDTIERKPKLANEAVCHKPCDSFSGYAPLLCIGPTSTDSATRTTSDATVYGSNPVITVGGESSSASTVTSSIATTEHISGNSYIITSSISNRSSTPTPGTSNSDALTETESTTTASHQTTSMNVLPERTTRASITMTVPDSPISTQSSSVASIRSSLTPFPPGDSTTSTMVTTKSGSSIPMTKPSTPYLSSSLTSTTSIVGVTSSTSPSTAVIDSEGNDAEDILLIANLVIGAVLLVAILIFICLYCKQQHPSQVGIGSGSGSTTIEYPEDIISSDDSDDSGSTITESNNSEIGSITSTDSRVTSNPPLKPGTTEWWKRAPLQEIRTYISMREITRVTVCTKIDSIFPSTTGDVIEHDDAAEVERIASETAMIHTIHQVSSEVRTNKFRSRVNKVEPTPELTTRMKLPAEDQHVTPLSDYSRNQLIDKSITQFSYEAPLPLTESQSTALTQFDENTQRDQLVEEPSMPTIASRSFIAPLPPPEPTASPHSVPKLVTGHRYRPVIPEPCSTEDVTSNLVLVPINQAAVLDTPAGVHRRRRRPPALTTEGYDERSEAAVPTATVPTDVADVRAVRSRHAWTDFEQNSDMTRSPTSEGTTGRLAISTVPPQSSMEDFSLVPIVGAETARVIGEPADGHRGRRRPRAREGYKEESEAAVSATGSLCNAVAVRTDETLETSDMMTSHPSKLAEYSQRNHMMTTMAADSTNTSYGYHGDRHLLLGVEGPHTDDELLLCTARERTLENKILNKWSSQSVSAWTAQDSSVADDVGAGRDDAVAVLQPESTPAASSRHLLARVEHDHQATMAEEEQRLPESQQWFTRVSRQVKMTQRITERAETPVGYLQHRQIQSGVTRSQALQQSSCELSMVPIEGGVSGMQPLPNSREAFHPALPSQQTTRNNTFQSHYLAID